MSARVSLLSLAVFSFSSINDEAKQDLLVLIQHNFILYCIIVVLIVDLHRNAASSEQYLWSARDDA